MKLIIASDHAAFEAKENLKQALGDVEFIDVGVDSADRANYPEYAQRLVKKVHETGELAVLLCGSGIGVSMVANRYQGIRAALVSSAEEAKLAKEHNNANVLCMGGRLRSTEQMKEMVQSWLNADFEGGRHSDRIEMFNQLGENPESIKS